ncbi:nitrogenase cofactor biosynthesis protein NifB [Denitrovibrio acetiphilus DSM 12809]|uniref:FeMo cofactor biosynthesis protein NifB n=1 Tax=Denitrovibrio acetiphilus (strain DSM 12809 / NBRC 114555 / N2460) TaxID=522772 RepID=D4H6W5_DENA2|nr:nitrogenase cofactor biosynthesis protein NifB [Denitrovibrio acetiphilus]ADD67831.1 nitrogenase cofactor biosynthesis protein NifB [Denitrovibrio acetiphilus DSM 12809]
MQKDAIREKIEKHPCYCKDAHDKYARIHLPVAPACNIQCNYCNRKYDCSNESRPGVTSGVLNPEQALEKVIMIEQSLENLSVVGIAGPGDALANPTATFQTLRLLKAYKAELIPCISTNGLNLPDYIDEIEELGISHVTVTMNAVDPEVGQHIYSWIHHEGVTYHGVEAAAKLLERQLQGVEMLVERGILVKINTVLIPGINDSHITEVAKKIKELGVFIHNILPLMSKPEYGTKFAKDGVPEPDIKMIAKARFDCAEIMGGFDNVMQHCRQCRADAIGKLGQDFDINSLSDEIINNSSAVKAQVMNIHRAFSSKAVQERTSKASRNRMVLVAVATENQYFSDVTFKNARTFYVYEVSGWGAHLREIRTLRYDDSDACIKLSGHLRNVQELLNDCSVMVCSVAGKSAVDEMRRRGIIIDTTGGHKVLEDAAWHTGMKRLKDSRVTA